MMRRKRNYITDSGGNGHVLILVHGFLGSSSYWRRLRPLLITAGYRVITIDLIGFGKAPKPRKAFYDYPAFMEHLRAAITSLNLRQPFTLVGHSMGALLAVRYALLYPEEIAAVISIHQPLFKNSTEAAASIRSSSRHRLLVDSRFRRAAWLVVKAFRYRHIRNHSAVARERSLLHVIEKAEGLNDLAKITKPTLLIVGRDDRAEYLKNLPQARRNPAITSLVVNTGHHSPYFQPEETFRWIEKFLKQVRG